MSYVSFDISNTINISQDCSFAIKKIGQEFCSPHKCAENRTKNYGYYSLHFVMYGQGILRSGDKTYKLSPGFAFLLYKGEEYEYYPDSKNPWSYFWIDLVSEHPEEFFSCLGFSKENPVIKINQMKDLMPILKELYQSYSQRLNGDITYYGYYSVSRRGSINDSECTGYSVELFIPYELFGREGRCNEVYVNTTHIAMPDWETTEVRNWYNFGGRQSSLYDWSSLNQGYTFDRNGAVINQLRIKQTAGGIVSEEFGYDYTITGDTVNITIQPDAGYKLSSLKVNGVESIDNVLNGVYYSFVSTGDCDIVPTFEKIEESKIKVSDVYAWIDYPASEFNIILNNGQSDYTLEYDSTKLLIDKEKGTVKALAEGKFEVKVISGSDTASFFVTCTKVDKNGGRWDSSGYEDKINNRSDKYKTDGINGDTTVLIGDSFFDNDEGNWSDFYTNYADIYHALELGIGGSTTFDWENFISAGKLDGWSPKNLVVNLGTNNIGGDNCSYEETAEALQRLFTVLHDKMPETNIYYFSIAQRYDTTSHSLKISSCNDIMQEWCEGKDWITFLDVEDQISGADLKDGLHPKDITYKNVYLKALEDAGVFVKH